MTLRSVILLGIAGFSALSMVLLVRAFLSEARTDRPETNINTDVQGILVATRTLHVGARLGEEDVTWQDWPEDALNTAYIGRGRPLSDVTGKIVRRPIMAGIPVTDDALVTPGDRSHLAAVLTPGMRAMTVSLGPVTGLAGFVFPGDRVDLVMTYRVEDDKRRRHAVSQTVLRNVRVLAVDQRSGRDAEEVREIDTATLEVTPAMAERVAIASQLGRLSLTLRSLERNGDDPLTDPASPPLVATMSATTDADISPFMDPIGGRRTAGRVRIARGNRVSTVDTATTRLVTTDNDGGERQENP